MKCSLILSGLIISILFVNSSYSQPQLENPGFESWEFAGTVFDEPSNWSSIKTSDGGTFINSAAPVVWGQSSDAHTGNFSVELFNANTIIGVAAGTLTNGRVHAEFDPGASYVYTDPTDSRWNTPFTERPDSIVVWIKYFPVDNDFGQVKAVLHNGEAQIPDPAMSNWIGLAEITFPSQELNNWTRLSAPFNYFNGDTPEYILIVIASGDGLNAIEGSIAYVDDLELIYTTTVDLTAFLEGPYDDGSGLMNTNLNPDIVPLDQPYNISPWNYNGIESVGTIPNPEVVDWVLVELRDTTIADYATYETMDARQAAFLLNNGSIVGLDGFSNLRFSSYINHNLFPVIWHRNHLGIMSAGPVMETGGVYSYDFSSGAGQVYSDGHKQIGTSVWGMIGGDGDADNYVGSSDKNSIWSIIVGKSGYEAGDYDLSGQISNQDKNDIWFDNEGSSSQIPE